MSILEDETVQFCSELIQIDTTSPYEGEGPGEREAVEYIQRRLNEVGIEYDVFESAPARTSLIARIPGRRRGALMLHCHLDVVPIGPEEWTFPPLGGAIADGCIWGRGALDMKNMAAAILACARHLMRTGTVPERDLVLAFFADEENGTTWGSKWMVENHSRLFTDVIAGLGEVGGFGLESNDGTPVYFLECARKGVAWLELTATDRSGHGSITRSESAISKIAGAVDRIGAYQWPVDSSGHNQGLVDAVIDYYGVDLSEPSANQRESALSGIDDFLRSAIRNVANVTVLRAGSSPNVVPGSASAIVDGRFLPDQQEIFLETIANLAGPNIAIRYLDLTEPDVANPQSAVVEEIRQALDETMPGSKLVTYVSSAGTDNASLTPLGIDGYGFVPQLLPPGFPFAGLFHSVDERIPITSLTSIARTLYALLKLSNK